MIYDFEFFKGMVTATIPNFIGVGSTQSTPFGPTAVTGSYIFSPNPPGSYPGTAQMQVGPI